MKKKEPFLGFEDHHESDSLKKELAASEEGYDDVVTSISYKQTNQRDEKSSMKSIVSPLLVTITFPLCLLSIKYSINSFMLSFLAMFIFIAFMSSVTVMLRVGARFTRIHITMLVISAMAILISFMQYSIVFFLVCVPIFAILFAGQCAVLAESSTPQDMFQSMYSNLNLRKC